MPDPEFTERVDRVRMAADVISALPEGLQGDAFHYLIGQPAGLRSHPEPEAQGGSEVEQKDLDGASASGTGDSTQEKKAPPRRSKPTNVNPDKNLDLAPTGKQSFAEFVTEKKPSTHIERYTSCVYWLREVAEYPKATIAQVVTCFHAASWKLPANVRNTASQAGKKHLDSSSLDDLKLSTLGRNLILDLPSQKKS